MKMLIPFRSELPDLFNRTAQYLHIPDLSFGGSFPTFKTTLQDKKGSYVVDLEIPGANKADINVEVLNNNILKVQGAQKYECSDRGYHVAQYGRFERSLKLPSDADPSSIQTKTNKDRVHIVIAKAGKQEPWYRRWMIYLKAAW